MVEQKSDNNVTTVSDILGFALEQSKKEPDKRTNINPKVDKNEAEYVKALKDTVSLPTAFINEETLNTLEELAKNQAKISDQVDTTIPSRFRIKVKDISKLIGNPKENINKILSQIKTISQMEKIQWAGEQMKMVLGSTYAKDKKLFEDYDEEMKNLLERAVGQSAAEGNEEDKKWIAKASQQIIQKGYAGNELKSLQTQLKSTKTPQEKANIEKRIKRIEGSYRNTQQTDNDENFYSGFRDLLKTEFEAHENSILNGRDEKDLDANEQRKYKKMQFARNTISLWGRYDKGPLAKRKFALTKKNIRENEQNLINQKDAILRGGVYTLPSGEKLDYSVFNSYQKQKEINKIKLELKRINDTTRAYGAMQFFSNLGNVEGLYYGVKQTLGPGGVEAMLRGDFYDPKKSYYGNPALKRSFSFENRKTGEVAKVDIVKPQKEGFGELRKTYNRNLVNVHYYNPVTWARSLATGESFAWIADRKIQKAANLWKGQKDLNNYEFWKFYLKYKNASAEYKNTLLQENKQYSNIIQKIVLEKETPTSKFSKKLEETEKVLGSANRFRSASEIFSTPKRFVSKIQDSTFNRKDDKELKGVVVNVEKALDKLDGISAGKTLNKAFKGFLGGSLTVLGEGVKGTFNTALAFVVNLEVARLLRKITYFSAMIVLLLFVYGVFWGGGIVHFKQQSQIDAYSREIPGEIFYNNFDDFGNSDGLLEPYKEIQDPMKPENYDDNINTPPPPNSSVLDGDIQDIYSQALQYVSSTYGPVNVSLNLVSPGDYWYEWLYEWAWCVSTPNGIYCKEDKLSSASSSYVYNLMVHELIHRLQSTGSTLMSEWGADYLSNNGGGYTFETADGRCIKATQVQTSSCSSDGLVDVALGRDKSSQCYQEVSSQIVGFCYR